MATTVIGVSVKPRTACTFSARGTRKAPGNSPKKLREGLYRHPSQRLRGGRFDLHRNELPGPSGAVEVDRLPMPRPPPQLGLVRTAGPFDQHVERPPDEPLGALG